MDLPGFGEPVVVDLDAVPAALFSVGVDDAEILSTVESLEEAVGLAWKALLEGLEGGTWSSGTRRGRPWRCSSSTRAHRGHPGAPRGRGGRNPGLSPRRARGPRCPEEEAEVARSWQRAKRALSKGTGLVEDLEAFLAEKGEGEGWGRRRPSSRASSGAGGRGIPGPLPAPRRAGREARGVLLRLALGRGRRPPSPWKTGFYDDHRLRVDLKGRGWSFWLVAPVRPHPGSREKDWTRGLRFEAGQDSSLEVERASRTPEGRASVRSFLEEFPGLLAALGERLASLLEEGLGRLEGEVGKWPGEEFLTWRVMRRLDPDPSA